jgi:phenylacetate-CoA ligase
VNVFPSQVEEQVLQMPALAPQYQLVVSKDGHLDKLEVRCELREGEFGDQQVQALAQELKHRIKTHIGVTTSVNVLPSQGIERSMTGKARRVVDQRNQQN